jgi:hypothetical protein
MEQVNCQKHGLQGFAFTCIHVAIAVDTRENVGFCQGDNEKPEMAWCSACDAHIKKHGWDDALKKKADFKMLCLRCFEDARAVLNN